MITHALQFTDHSTAAPQDVLTLNKVELPAVPPHGHVRVRIIARPINPADLLFIAGRYGGLTGTKIAARQPQTAGSEGAGVVVAVGEGITSVRVGQRVYAPSFMPDTGTWAEYVDVNVAGGGLLVPLPDAVSFTAGCQLFVNPLTATGFVQTAQEAGVVAGDHIVLTGGASSVVKMFLDLVKDRKLGWHCIAIVRRSSQKADLEARGASAISSDDEDVTARLKQLTAGKGVKVAFDALGGGPVASAVVSSLQHNGKFYIYGVLDPSPLAVDTGRLLFEQWRIEGWYLSDRIASFNWQMSHVLGTVLGDLARGIIKAEAQEFDLVTQWKDALAFMHGPSTGAKPKTVLTSPL